MKITKKVEAVKYIRNASRNNVGEIFLKAGENFLTCRVYSRFSLNCNLSLDVKGQIVN